MPSAPSIPSDLIAAIPAQSTRLQQTNAGQQTQSSPFAAFLDGQETSSATPAASPRDARTATPGSAASSSGGAPGTTSAATRGGAAAKASGGNTPPVSGQTIMAANATNAVTAGKSNVAGETAAFLNATGTGKSNGSARGATQPNGKREPTSPTDSAPATTTTTTNADDSTNTSNSTAAQPVASADPNTDQSAALVDAANALNLAAGAGAATSVAKVAQGGSAKHDDGSDTTVSSGKTDSAATSSSTAQTPQTAGQPQQTAPPNLPQPIAAAIVLNTPADAAASGAAPTTTIDAQAKPRGKAAPSGDQSATTPSAKDTAGAAPTAGASNQSSAKQAPSDATAAQSSQTNASNNSAAKNADASKSAASTQQAPSQTNGNATVFAGNGTAVQGSTDRAQTLSDAAGTTAAPGASGQANAPTVTGSGIANGLPNIGLVSANAATTASGASAAASASAVPIAGLGVAITSHAQSGSNTFDIRLAPPELGGINVRLDVDSSGQVTSHITVDRPDTLQLLQSQQPQIQHALEQAGLKTADNGLQFTLRDQSFAGQNGTGGNPGGQQNTAQLVIPDAEMTPVDTAQIYSRLSLSNGLDIRV